MESDPVRAVLISCYDLGHQPFGLAEPAAWLRRSGIGGAKVAGGDGKVASGMRFPGGNKGGGNSRGGGVEV